MDPIDTIVETRTNSGIRANSSNTRFSSIDLKNFYLDTSMPNPEYVRIKITDIPEEFIEEYNLAGRDRDGWIYFEICQGCYGLPQAGILANDLL
jgi:hypothetical protein